jgi:hypothetical protein
MENPGIPKPRNTNLVRRGCVMGGISFALFAAVIQLTSSLAPPGENSWGLLIIIPWLLSALPTLGLYHVLGWKWGVGSVNEVPASVFWSIIAVNTFLGVLLGGAIGLCLTISRRKSNRL